MIRNTVIVTRNYYYPLGNTPAVCLTQDLPPEQDADILLLGCGDVRNVLFTCFADAARKIDVTCCDIEPGVHARNILLYSLLIEDKENLNVVPIWNIYYHWKLDKSSIDLLETQTGKLLEVSKSIEVWHASVYGSSIRFCDERSLSFVRSHWTGFQSQGLSAVKKKQRQNQLQAALDRAKTVRGWMVGKNSRIRSDLRCTSPILGSKVVTDLCKVSEQWWDCGTTPSTSGTAQKSTELNPAFLYTQNQTLTLHYGLSPIVGFPLGTAYVPIAKESQFHLQSKRASSIEHLVDCAKNHLAQWASAFRRAVENKSVIRIFCGDALAFGLTLHHCGVTGPSRVTSMNLFSDNWTNSPLKLHHVDYGWDKNAAPLRFDIIDTSNLADHLGPLNIVGIGSSLLKFNASSSLYTEMLVQRDANIADRLFGFFGVDARTMSLMFGLVLPELFTHATDGFDFDSALDQETKLMGFETQVRSRLRWKRLQGFQESAPYLRVEAKELAKLLIEVHDVMFAYEDPTSMLNSLMLNGITESHLSTLSKQTNICYNRLSFALLLNLLRATVVTDWDQCTEYVCKSCWRLDSMSSIKTNCRQDLALQMRLCGVFNMRFFRPFNMRFFGPTLFDVRDAVLAPIIPLRANEDVPDQLCVTVRVSKQKLRVFTAKDMVGTPAITCTFEGKDPGDDWLDIFSAVQVTFGTWHGQTKDDMHPYIEEDTSHLYGPSDMFVSVYIPTLMLLQSKRAVPRVSCGLIRTSPNFMRFVRVLGRNLYFSCNEMTDKDVFVTRFMPGMSGLPAFAVATAQQGTPMSPTTTVRLTQEGSKIASLIQRVPVKCPEAKTKLANPSSPVEIEFKSPLVAVISIAKTEELKLEFPFPVSPYKYKVRVARKSSYIEVETPPFDPLKEDAASFIFPTLITEAPCSAVVPVSWTSTRVDLDSMPPIDLKNVNAIPWMKPHVFQMFSKRERDLQVRNTEAEKDARSSLKDTIFAIFMSYTGLLGQQAEFFRLSTVNDGNQTLIFPSCLRLDLVNHTVLLDTAIIPVTSKMSSDPRIAQLLQELCRHFMQCKISENENHAWKVVMPTFVERCRTSQKWSHASSCEYIQAGEIPLSQGLNEDGVSPICSCGIGQFPGGYLESQMKKFPDLSYLVRQFATRAAIAPIFVVPYVEGCSSETEISTFKEKCVKCGKSGREGEQGLLACSRCKTVRYCSKECQKADWKKHKPVCSAA